MAMTSIAQQVKSGDINVEDIDEAMITQHLTISDIPMIDTGPFRGECRISNFMLWQLAYAEMYFTGEFCRLYNEDSLVEAVT